MLIQARGGEEGDGEGKIVHSVQLCAGRAGAKYEISWGKIKKICRAFNLESDTMSQGRIAGRMN